MSKLSTLTWVALLSLGADSALACGGFFCNSLTPVTQSAERILFARDGDQIEMHVQINYQGPSVDFGWILPAAPDVETDVSTEALFSRLDGAFQPRFRLDVEYGPNCEFLEEEFLADSGLAGNFDGAVPPPAPMVNVLSREAVGPYDRVILQADNTQVLFEWLAQNEFAIPADAADRLEPYIEGHVFVAIKLLAGNDSDDIKPLRLRYTAPQPSIPLRPTAVAAQPDMGIIVYVLGAGRAVTLNYLHVEINDALINWERGGDNYEDVVSHAVDQAGGRAFVTDFAGPHADAIGQFQVEVDLDGLRMVRNLAQLLDYARALRSPDLIKLVREVVVPPEGVDVDDVLQRPFDYDAQSIAVDGAALVAAIETQILPVYQGLNGLFAAHAKLTRLFSTMSADEMEVDPLFDLNVDLADVSNLHVAQKLITCGGEPGEPDANFPGLNEGVVTTPSGHEYRSEDGENPNRVIRQEGQTVRGMEQMAAAIIEQQMPAGQSEMETDNRPEIEEMMPPIGGAGGGGGGADDDDSSGCICDATEGPVSPVLILGALILFGLRRRRIRGRRPGR